jgi:uncharacterized protein (TIGR02996 family)
MDDPSFLEAIFQSPDDVAVRLVYADWLEERGDIRGELLRLRVELAGMKEKDRRRKKLLQRERELLPHCDERWLVLLERAGWRKLYDELEPTGKHRPRWASDRQEAIGKALAAFEAERGHKLPRSYKSFAHVFGTGELSGLFFVEVPDLTRPGNLSDIHQFFREAVGRYSPATDRLLRRAICFAVTVDGECIVFDPVDVTEPVGMEYRIHWLDLGFGDTGRSADSFREFIEDFCLARRASFAPH